MTVGRIEDFQALEPFFRVIEDGLAGLAGGGHFFDLLAGDAVFEFIITVPGYPRRIAGRGNLIDLYRGYRNAFFPDRCFGLRTHRAGASTVTLEYASEGRAVATGRPYSNHYISVVTTACGGPNAAGHQRSGSRPAATAKAGAQPARGPCHQRRPRAVNCPRQVRRPIPPQRRRHIPIAHEDRLVVPDTLDTTIKLTFLEGPVRLAPADYSQRGKCCHLYRSGRRDVP
jgi:uncharacterized protein